MKPHNYFVYIVTNATKTTLYIGVTNDLERRLQEHFDHREDQKAFAGQYFCYNLVFYERHSDINHAIEREKKLKMAERKEE